MADFPYGRASVARKLGLSEQDAGSASANTPIPAGKYCAYNQTRQRFLCANVEVADTSSSRLDALLPGLTSTTGRALWIVPIQAIAPTSVRIPLDLIYLDRSSVVVDAVESFPIAQPVAAGSATSVLALPAQSIHSSGTRPGDSLILCTPEEMKHRLQQLAENEAPPAVHTANAPSPNLAPANPVPQNDLPGPKTPGNVLPFIDRANPRPSSETVAAEPVPAVQPAPPTPAAEPQPKQEAAPRWKVADSRSWFQRLLEPEPPDPRKAQREMLTGLVAYFFTGGRPVAQNVRDISSTGVFVYTEERWYPGTVVRITLTDQHDPSTERSLTVNAKVVRATNDGVGFQFLLKDEKDGNGSSSGVDRQAQCVLRTDVDLFIWRFKSKTP